MIPHDFFTLSEHLDFLGVTLKATFAGTKKVNEDILQDSRAMERRQSHEFNSETP